MRKHGIFRKISLMLSLVAVSLSAGGCSAIENAINPEVTNAPDYTLYGVIGNITTTESTGTEETKVQVELTQVSHTILQSYTDFSHEEYGITDLYSGLSDYARYASPLGVTKELTLTGKEENYSELLAKLRENEGKLLQLTVAGQEIQECETTDAILCNIDHEWTAPIIGELPVGITRINLMDVTDSSSDYAISWDPLNSEMGYSCLTIGPATATTGGTDTASYYGYTFIGESIYVYVLQFAGSRQAVLWVTNGRPADEDGEYSSYSSQNIFITAGGSHVSMIDGQIAIDSEKGEIHALYDEDARIEYYISETAGYLSMGDYGMATMDVSVEDSGSNELTFRRDFSYDIETGIITEKEAYWRYLTDEEGNPYNGDYRWIIEEDGEEEVEPYAVKFWSMGPYRYLKDGEIQETDNIESEINTKYLED